MSTSHDGDQVLERSVVLATDRLWQAATPVSAPDLRTLENEDNRMPAQTVGDHLPYELALRAAELAAQLQPTSARAREHPR